MTLIKICGLTREIDIDIVNKYRPDFVGFVFAESRRQIDEKTASKLIQKLDKSIKSVGIFVDEDIEMVKEITILCGLNVVQLHGNEDAEYIKKCKQILPQGVEIWKAMRIKDTFPALDIGADRYLLDSKAGGSGKTFDWTLANGIDKSNIILAGGLGEHNILEAIRTFNPYAVDVSSAVETDGMKDEQKIAKFIETVRNK